MTSFFRQQLERWLSRIDVKCDSVLDVGGGQNPIKNRVNSWDVKEYKILDNDVQYKPDYLHDMNTSVNIKTTGGKRFDIIFCLEVAEYIWSPVTFHWSIWKLLKDDGVAYISYPTIYPLHNPPGIDYLRYTKNAIEKYLKEVGFKTWEITPRIATEGLKSLSDFYSYERMRAMKETDEIFNTGYMVKAFK